MAITLQVRRQGTPRADVYAAKFRSSQASWLVVLNSRQAAADTQLHDGKVADLVMQMVERRSAALEGKMERR